MNRALFGSADKAPLLAQMMLEDFADGLLLIDPDGTLAETIASHIPVNHTERVVYFDPADPERLPGFNLLAQTNPAERDKLTEDFCALFPALFPHGWGDQSNFILSCCVRLLLDQETASLLEIYQLLNDPDFRSQCLSSCTNPVVSAGWDLIAKWEPKQYQAAISPLLNKITAILLSKARRDILCKKRSTFRLDGHIVIANLDRRKLGDRTALYLGSFLMARSQGAVYLNNAGFYASDQLASQLSQDRFTLTLQFLSDLRPRDYPSLEQKVLSIEHKSVFRTTREDAERLAFYLGVDNPNALMAPELDPGQYRDLAGVHDVEPLSAGKRLRVIKKRSRARYTQPIPLH